MLLAIILVVLSCLSQISHRQGIYLKRAAAISSAICIVCFTVMFCCTSNNKVRVLDVGKGSSMVVSVNDTVVVIGAGDDKNDADRIVREILAMGKKECDYLILPNLNKNISGGAAAFIRQFPNTEVILPKSGEYFDDVEYLLNGNGVYFDDDCYLSLGGGQVLLVYKENSVIVELKEDSLIFYCGDDNIIDSNLKDSVIVCAGVLPENIEDIDKRKIVLSGENDSLKNFYQKNILEYEITNAFSGGVNVY